MTRRTPWRPQRPTQKAVKAAFASQAPLDSDAQLPGKKKHKRGDDELPEFKPEDEE